MSPERSKPPCVPVGSLRTSRQGRRARQGFLFAAAVLPFALTAVCESWAHAQPTAIGDRYSGDVYVPPAYRQAMGRQAMGASGPTLSWPGKTAAPGVSEPMQAPAYAYTAAAYGPSPAYPTTARPAPAYSARVSERPAPQAHVYGPPPVRPWYEPADAGDAPSARAPAAPTSIYDPPAAPGGASTSASRTPSPAAAVSPPARAATAANDGETARFYSLHRQYGLTPDPDPIPPQFFTQTADLGDPPGPSPVYKAAANGGSTTAVHPVQSDESTSTLGQP
jgi:hypothetical protein